MKTPSSAQLGLIQREAANGNAKRQLQLGALYQKGKGVKRDFSQASEWYQKAAEQGNAIAQAKLAGLYWYGRGVAKDLSVASALSTLSIQNGHTLWLHRLADYLLKQSLTPQQLLYAQELVKKWAAADDFTKMR